MPVKRDYYVTIDGREEEIKVDLEEKEPFIYEVEVDGNKYNVDFAQINEAIYSIIIDGRSYAVEISEKGNNFEVIVDGDNYKVEVLDEMKRFMKMRTSTAVEGRQVVEAQMPGYIWKRLKDVGDEVEEGETVMILVAMKMENEIKSPKKGVITEIFVEASEDPNESTVTIGDKLFIVE